MVDSPVSLPIREVWRVVSPKGTYRGYEDSETW